MLESVVVWRTEDVSEFISEADDCDVGDVVRKFDFVLDGDKLCIGLSVATDDETLKNLETV